MAKLQLVANPTFQKNVGVPVAGGSPVDVLMTFKHRTKKELEEFIETRPEKSDAESFMAMVTGWDLSDVFNAANVDLMLENYIGTAVATYRVYIDELVQAKIKN